LETQLQKKKIKKASKKIENVLLNTTSR